MSAVVISIVVVVSIFLIIVLTTRLRLHAFAALFKIGRAHV